LRQAVGTHSCVLCTEDTRNSLGQPRLSTIDKTGEGEGTTIATPDRPNVPGMQRKGVECSWDRMTLKSAHPEPRSRRARENQTPKKRGDPVGAKAKDFNQPAVPSKGPLESLLSD
jgi:hypothetical protein